MGRVALTGNKGLKMKRLKLFCLLTFLPAFGPAAAAETSHLCSGNGTQLQQLRIYEVIRDNRDPFHERFRDHALRIMRRHQFNVIDIWESDTGDKLQFIYVLNWPDRATMDERWKAFMADPEWSDIKKRSSAEHGPLVRSAEGQPLVRLSYSPACRSTEVK
jgi:hypothetical protein